MSIPKHSSFLSSRLSAHTHAHKPHTWDAYCMWPDFAFLYTTKWRQGVKRKKKKQDDSGVSVARWVKGTECWEKQGVVRGIIKRVVGTTVRLNTWTKDCQVDNAGWRRKKKNATQLYSTTAARTFEREREKATGKRPPPPPPSVVPTSGECHTHARYVHLRCSLTLRTHTLVPAGLASFCLPG